MHLDLLPWQLVIFLTREWIWQYVVVLARVYDWSRRLLLFLLRRCQRRYRESDWVYWHRVRWHRCWKVSWRRSRCSVYLVRWKHAVQATT